jgi:hypothetical protein
MSEIPQQLTPEQEIKILEQQLAEKKRALETLPEVKKPEKQLFHEVVREHMETIRKPQDDTAKKTFVFRPSAKQTDDAKKKADDLKETEHKEQVESLVEIALSKGIVDAVETARHLNDPHLLDDFHDAIVDVYFDKLVAAREVESF